MEVGKTVTQFLQSKPPPTFQKDKLVENFSNDLPKHQKDQLDTLIDGFVPSCCSAGYGHSVVCVGTCIEVCGKASLLMNQKNKLDIEPVKHN